MQQQDSQHLLVTGVSSQVGNFLLPHLAKGKFVVTAISRQAPKVTEGICWLQADITNIADRSLNQLHEVAMVIHLAPLPLLLALMPKLIDLGVKRIVAFSTTSCYTKLTSRSSKDSCLAMQFQNAEMELQKICEQHEIAWTILRPTLIYSSVDKSINFVARFIKKFGFFPLVGKGMGLRQPVHAEDLAEACLKVLTCVATYNQSYNLSGGEALPYREMVTRIFFSLNKKPRFISIPLPLLRSMLLLLSLLPSYRYLTADMADRMNANHDFTHADASRDFGYLPRAFIL